MKALLALASLAVLSACAVVHPLPRNDAWNGDCRGVGLDATLTGNPSDPRIAWLVASTGRRIDIMWPPGYTARFEPLLEVLNADGTVVFREGSNVTDGCVTGPDAQGPFLIHPDS